MSSSDSPKWLRRAKRLNPYYQKRLGWRVPDRWPAEVGSTRFARHVAAFQHEHGGLQVDGVLGPKTHRAYQGSVWEPPVSDHLIVNGERVAVPFPVVSWEEPDGISLYDHGGYSARTPADGSGIDLFVLHWDVCLSSHQCFQVLVQRRRSVHLLLDGDGTIYQCLDLAKIRAWHASGVNNRSVGVEIQNPVHAHLNEHQDPQRSIVSERRPHGGSTYQHLDFYQVQKKRSAELADALCDILKIPRRLPMHTDGTVKQCLAEPKFKGVAGHYHFSKRKPDPGLSLWPTMKSKLLETGEANV